jgi:hypothetical protein
VSAEKETNGYQLVSCGIGALYDAGIRQGAKWIATHIRAKAEGGEK